MDNKDVKNPNCIPVGCEELENSQDSMLASWAIKYSEILYKNEPKATEETYRTRFRRDKDRILYSKGFRRLQHKTQVIVTEAGDDFRTRLTHSLEVEQIATSLADALRVNKDLVSAISLGHDLGHTPFGHAVEALLDAKSGAFSHAIQSVRYLENQAKDRNGLNISIQVLEGILKHDSDVFNDEYSIKYKNQHDCAHLTPEKPGSIESQIVFWADKIAYLTHDFEDFSKSGILKEAVDAGKVSNGELEEVLSTLINDSSSQLTRDLVRNVTRSLIEGTCQNLLQQNPKTSAEAIEITYQRMIDQKKVGINSKEAYQNALLVNVTDDYRKSYNKLRKILSECYLRSPDVRRSDTTAKRMVESIIDEFFKDTSLLPWRIQKYIIEKYDTKERAIADFIASMTDRQVKSLYHKLFEIGDYNQYE